MNAKVFLYTGLRLFSKLFHF